eukprot:6174990-Pleurochrysis_carterae.AAC.2
MNCITKVSPDRRIPANGRKKGFTEHAVKTTGLGGLCCCGWEQCLQGKRGHTQQQTSACKVTTDG